MTTYAGTDRSSRDRDVAAAFVGSDGTVSHSLCKHDRQAPGGWAPRFALTHSD